MVHPSVAKLLHGKVKAGEFIMNKQMIQKVQAELQRLEELFENEDVTQKIDTLKDKFSICEIVYKIILKDYLKSKNEDTKKLVINMTQAKAALKYAGYIFDSEIVGKVFGSQKAVGSRSVKIIRDELNHTLKQIVVKELIDRYDELIGYMDSFLNMIRQGIE